jgi:hypothetical protein
MEHGCHSSKEHLKDTNSVAARWAIVFGSCLGVWLVAENVLGIFSVDHEKSHDVLVESNGLRNAFEIDNAFEHIRAVFPSEIYYGLYFGD